MHDGDPNAPTAMRGCWPLFPFAHARPPGGAEASATPALAIGEIGARARHGHASAQARCAQPLAPWCAGSQGRLG